MRKGYCVCIMERKAPGEDFANVQSLLVLSENWRKWNRIEKIFLSLLNIQLINKML